MAWLGDWRRSRSSTALPAFLLLLFPDGHLLSPRWRVGGVVRGYRRGARDGRRRADRAARPSTGYTNPIAPGGAAADFVARLGTVTDMLALPALLLAAAALVVRLRRSRGVERLQLKWFTYAASLAGVGLGLTTVTRGHASPTPRSSSACSASSRSRSRPASRSCATGSTTSTS